MSTSYSSAKQQYIGNGATTEWGFDFPVQTNSDLKVYLKRAGQSQVLLESGVDYIFMTANTIIFPWKVGEAKLQADDVLVLQRESVFESEYNFSNQQRLEPQEVMNADDNLERQIQELKRDFESTIKVQPTSNVDPNVFFDHVERVYDSVDNIDTVANDKANVDTVATNIESVKTVSTDISAVKTVADNIESVVIDAQSIDNVNTVAGSIANVNTTAGSIDSVNAVAPSIDNVNAVAPKIEDVTTVAANVSDVNTVAGSITNVNRVGESIANVNTVAGITDDVDQVAMIADQTKNVGDNISDVMTVAGVSEQVKTVAANATAVKDIGDNIDIVLQAPEDARKANVWAEGTDSQVSELGGTHSAKEWAAIAESLAQIDSASETRQGIARIATSDEAVGGENDLTFITPRKAKYIADEYTGKIVQLGFNATLENNVLTFVPDQEPYEIKAGYEYEIDLLFPAAGVLPDSTQMVIQNGTDTINLVNVKDSNASAAMTYGNMKQMCRYDAEIGWRWIFNARYAITDTGVKVFVMPSAVIDDSKYVTTNTAQNITAGKNFVNNATSNTTDAHTGMSITLKNNESDITANTQNEDGSVDFKYQGVRFVDKNNEETGFIYNAPDGVGGSFTRVGTSAKVDGQYVDSFIEMEVGANGKGHVYLPDVDEDATVSGNQAATVNYVKSKITEVATEDFFERNPLALQSAIEGFVNVYQDDLDATTVSFHVSTGKYYDITSLTAVPGSNNEDFFLNGSYLNTEEKTYTLSSDELILAKSTTSILYVFFKSDGSLYLTEKQPLYKPSTDDVLENGLYILKDSGFTLVTDYYAGSTTTMTTTHLSCPIAIITAAPNENLLHIDIFDSYFQAYYYGFLPGTKLSKVTGKTAKGYKIRTTPTTYGLLSLKAFVAGIQGSILYDEEDQTLLQSTTIGYLDFDYKTGVYRYGRSDNILPDKLFPLVNIRPYKNMTTSKSITVPYYKRSPMDSDWRVVSTYNSNESGFRVWSDGFIEQWGYTKGQSTVTFLKPYSNLTYIGFATSKVEQNTTTAEGGSHFFPKTLSTAIITPSLYGVPIFWIAYGY